MATPICPIYERRPLLYWQHMKNNCSGGHLLAASSPTTTAAPATAAPAASAVPPAAVPQGLPKQGPPDQARARAEQPRALQGDTQAWSQHM